MLPDEHETPHVTQEDLEHQNLLDIFLHISETILELTDIQKIGELLQQILKKGHALMKCRGSAISLLNADTGTYFPLQYDGIELTLQIRKTLRLESKVDVHLFTPPRYRISEIGCQDGALAEWKLLELPIGGHADQGGAMFLFFAKEDDIPLPKILLMQCYCNLVFSAIRSALLLQQSREQATVIEKAHQKQEIYNDALANANVRAVDLIAETEQAQLLAEARTKELAFLNEKLTEASRLKSEFLANMSHELRTPLNSIIGFSSMLLKEIDGPLLPEQKDSAAFIQSSGKHLLELINGILDLSKIEAGHMELNIEPCDVGEIILAATQTVDVLFHEHGLYLTTHVEPDLPLAYVDPSRVRQILVNMLGNAAKFTKLGGADIRCSIETAQSGLIPSKLMAANRGVTEYLLVSVIDTGCGIKEENYEKVFDKFRQIDGSSTREQGGTGLGMAISKEIAQLHRGDIWIRSIIGKGSTFSVALPLVGNSSTQSTPVHLPGPAERSANTNALENCTSVPTSTDLIPGIRKSHVPIFIVDDQPTTIAYYKKCLEGTEFRPITFMTDENTVRNAAAILPNAIILDIMLPSNDGWAILRELKQNAQTQSIPVIICSALEDERGGTRQGVAEYLVKPVDRKVLLETLKKYVNPAVKTTR